MFEQVFRAALPQRPYKAYEAEKNIHPVSGLKCSYGKKIQPRQPTLSYKNMEISKKGFSGEAKSRKTGPAWSTGLIQTGPQSSVYKKEQH